MKYKPPTNQEMARALSPFFPCFSSITQSVESDVLRACGVLGLPRTAERSTDFHRAYRTTFRSWCDETDGLFRMVEEPEGLGLDAIVCSLILDQPFVIRTGRLNKGRVRRNDSKRQREAKACGRLSSGLLFPEMDVPAEGELAQVSLVYVIEDEGTRGGVPAWFVGRLVLGTERIDDFDELAEVARYSKPQSIAEDVRRAVVEPNEEQIEGWRRQIRRARSSG